LPRPTWTRATDRYRGGAARAAGGARSAWTTGPGSSLSRGCKRGYSCRSDQDGDIAVIERCHLRAGRGPHRQRQGHRPTNLPFRDFEHNRVWLALVLLAHDLLAWTKTLLLSGDLARAEPKRLRYRLLHVAARLAFHARAARLRLQANWPWATDLAAAFSRLHALPDPAG
jgi:Transposase DDE domain group 1